MKKMYLNFRKLARIGAILELLEVLRRAEQMISDSDPDDVHKFTSHALCVAAAHSRVDAGNYRLMWLYVGRNTI